MDTKLQNESLIMKKPNVKSMKRKLKKYLDKTSKEKLLKEVEKRKHLQELQLNDFIETGVVPTLPPKDRMRDALQRCVWLLNSNCARKSLKGFDVDFVVQYAEEALKVIPEKTKSYVEPKSTGKRYSSVRDMLIDINCSKKVLRKFDGLVAKMPAVYDETGKMLGFVHLDTDEFEPVTFLEFKNQVSKELKKRSKDDLFKKQGK